MSAKPDQAKLHSAPPRAAAEGLEHLLAQVVFEAVWERDLDKETVRWSGNFESMFGYPRAHLPTAISWWRERVHPDDVARVEAESAEAIRGRASDASNEYRFRRHDGSWAWVASRFVIVRDEHGRARRLVGAMMDVSKLKDAESRLRLFTEQIPARATVTDRDLRVLWDLGAAYPENPSTVGMTVPELFAQSPDRDRVLDGCRQALAGVSSELEIDDGTAAAHLKLAPIRDASGRITGVVGLAFDITERVRAEEALRKTERLLVDAEKLGRTGSWEQDLVTGEIYNSDTSRHLFFGDDASKGSRFEDYVEAIHPDDRERVVRGRQALLAGTGSGDIEFRVVWPEGSVHVIFGRATVVRDDNGKPIRVYGTNADVTERRRTQEELARRARRLQLLSRKLIETQEAERRSLANELHDDLGQMLFALRLNLVRGGGENDESLALVDGAIARMRQVVQELRPPLLDEFGLEASLRSHVEREAARAGLTFRLSVAVPAERPPTTVEITCFRVAQEALSNVIRHANARTVDIALNEGHGALELTVRDDGRGFDVPAAKRRAVTGGSHGLLSMQERVALVDGDLEIESTPGRGARIRARLPLRPR